MRAYLLYACIFACLFPAVPAKALTVQEVTFADQIELAATTLTLHNAALLRYMNVVKVYVAALYLPTGTTAAEVLADVPKRLELNYLVAISGGDFAKAAEPVLLRNQGQIKMDQLRSRIDRLHAAYRNVQAGDRYALTYVPGVGTELALNGAPLVSIEGADFASAYFGIWLGEKPIDAKLKSALLKRP
jgi:hypothetical protein